jgi:hypothetical protein
MKSKQRIVEDSRSHNTLTIELSKKYVKKRKLRANLFKIEIITS